METDTQTEVQPSKDETHAMGQFESIHKAKQDLLAVASFASRHKPKLDGTNWRFYVDRDIHILPGSYGFEINTAREIARRFPGVVWKRVKNEYTCGQIDWVATVEGVTIVIETAEKLTFKDGDLVSL